MRDAASSQEERQREDASEEEQQSSGDAPTKSPSVEKPTSLDTILRRELSLTESLLKRDIKSYPTWHHRKWIMELLNDPEEWKREIQNIILVLKYDLRNFHCWNYRRHLLQLLHYDPKEELQFLENLFEDNPSNYSAWHNRSLMIHTLKQKGEDISQLIADEFEWCKQGFYTDPADSAAWIYHRWLLHSEEGKKQNLVQQDDELCEELSEMAQEEDTPQERAVQMKWPHLTHLLNVVELHQNEEFSPDRMEQILKKFSELIEIDPKRKNFYKDKRSDFIIQHTETAGASRETCITVHNQSLTRLDAVSNHSNANSLTCVDFSHNHIRQLSIFMSNLPNMQTLQLNDNHIKNIEGISQFTALTRLELRNNRIEFIGNEKVLSETLKVLDLRGNKLREDKFASMDYLRSSFPNLVEVLYDGQE